MKLKTKNVGPRASLAKRAPAKRSPRKVSAAKTTRTKAMQAKSSRQKVKAYRERMRKRGMKLIQIWVPDTQSPEFAKEAHRQSLRAARSPTERDDQAFMDSIADRDWR